MSVSATCTAWMTECLECHCQTSFSLKHFGMWWMTMTKSRHSRVNDSKWPKSQAGLCEEEDGAEQSCSSESAMLNTPWRQGGSDGIWPGQLTERLLLFSHWHSLQSAATVTPVKWNYIITVLLLSHPLSKLQRNRSACFAVLVLEGPGLRPDIGIPWHQLTGMTGMNIWPEEASQWVSWRCSKSGTPAWPGNWGQRRTEQYMEVSDNFKNNKLT